MVTTVSPNRKLSDTALAWVACEKPLIRAYWRIMCVGPVNTEELLEAVP
jgi:hypothetical protein